MNCVDKLMIRMICVYERVSCYVVCTCVHQRGYMRHAWVPFLTLNKKRIKIATLRILIEHIYSEDFKITVLFIKYIYIYYQIYF